MRGSRPVISRTAGTTVYASGGGSPCQEVDQLLGEAGAGGGVAGDRREEVGDLGECGPGGLV
ncbi:hypothetical protein ACTWPT_38015 [Nonomuraea sp. 3N208]|uniref:hypothetical protein n=1 Tax=Nonomuraea sp. 3N208 TaxID=3457421 RepID=UPI003FD48088